MRNLKYLSDDDLTEDEKKAIDILYEIGDLAEKSGSDDIEIDEETLDFLERMLPQIEAMLATIH